MLTNQQKALISTAFVGGVLVYSYHQVLNHGQLSITSPLETLAAGAGAALVAHTVNKLSSRLSETEQFMCNAFGIVAASFVYSAKTSYENSRNYLQAHPLTEDCQRAYAAYRNTCTSEWVTTYVYEAVQETIVPQSSYEETCTGVYPECRSGLDGARAEGVIFGLAVVAGIAITYQIFLRVFSD